jgi:GTP-binding protein
MELEKFSNWLFMQECKFIAGAKNKFAIPELPNPEFAFAGCSNVGKSSIINALTNRLKLAKTSNTPGATRQINFFSIGNRITLVDLPGYGYAKVSKKELDNWSKLILNYIKNRNNLQKLFLLIDSRRIIKETDEILMNILDEVGLLYQIILTKIDKLSQIELEKTIEFIKESTKKHPALHPDIISISAKKKINIEKLRIEITKPLILKKQ